LLVEPVAKSIPTSLLKASQQLQTPIIDRSFLPDPQANNVSAALSVALLHRHLLERLVELLPHSRSPPSFLVESDTQNVSVPVSAVLKQVLEQLIADDVFGYPPEELSSLPAPLIAFVSVFHVTIIILGAKLGELWVLGNLIAKPMNRQMRSHKNQALLRYLAPAALVIPCSLEGRVLLTLASLNQIATCSGLFFVGQLLEIHFVLRDKPDSSKETCTVTPMTIKVFPTLALFLLGISSTLEVAALPAIAFALFVAGAHDWLTGEEHA
jgi:hypothetical protein